MSKDNNIIERKGGLFRFPSSVFLNLFALAVFLAAVIILHQVWKKEPSVERPEQAVQKELSTPDHSGATEHVVATASEKAPAKKIEKKAAVDEPVKKTKNEVVQKDSTSQPSYKRYAATKRWRAQKRSVARKKQTKAEEVEPSVEHLDNEYARRNYVVDNYRLSAGLQGADSGYVPSAVSDLDLVSPDTEYTKQRTYHDYYDLDSEAQRLKYLEENKRLSKK
jgi:hypothetical protein